MKSRWTLLVIIVLCVTACGNEKKAKSVTAPIRDENVPVFSETKTDEDIIVASHKNELAAVNNYTVSDSCAGPFKIDAVIPEKIEGFIVIETKEEKILPGGERYEIPVYIYEIGNEGWVKVTPQYDTATGCATGKTSEIFVYSDLFITDKGIGAMSSVEEFATVYPDFRISYDRDAELFVAETQELKNVQFIIDSEYYRNDVAIPTSCESVGMQVSDFKDKSYFTAIRITK